MQYRRVGRAGLQLSELSLGSWVTYANQLDAAGARELMALAYDRGVNFFDNAEGYADGESERLMGAAFKALGWPRLNYVVATKFSWVAFSRQPEMWRNSPPSPLAPWSMTTAGAPAGTPPSGTQTMYLRR